ncbi:MAG: hypothetical protein FJ009_13005 [Chloroflexi bacterium]|nr:hypothetical protein [Chloroflexota bacterium]
MLSKWRAKDELSEVAVFNALIVAALGIALGSAVSLWIAGALGALGFAAALVLQFRFIASRYAEK